MPPSREQPTSPSSPPLGTVARWEQGSLQSVTVGALPILNHILQRLNLEALLQAHLPRDDPRSKLPVARGLLLLVRNLLLCREPLYGLGAWAASHDPQLLGLSPAQVGALNDDRVGRCLTTLFHSNRPALLLDLMRRVITEFGVHLDELHNDSTTITFHGAYSAAAEEQQRRLQKTLAITWGHNKDHRPDLKQLLYILTISADGGVPVHYRLASGNVTDDRTHQDNWELLCQIAGHRDFLYIADCKLATVANMNYIAAKGGRFVSVLPRTRKEDRTFRERLQQKQVSWQPLWDKYDEQGEICDHFDVCTEKILLPEGYRLWWFHSTRKAELDLAARSSRVQRAEQRLRQLQDKLRSPRSRLRDQGKVQEAVQQILQDEDVTAYVQVVVSERSQETYRQRRPGRPSQNTDYVKKVDRRLDLNYTLVTEALARERLTDGIFPLVTNDDHLSAFAVLQAYKRQPAIEKRFEQLKTDFHVAPVFLKDVGRIEALLCIYFLVLLVEALLERELRQAMEQSDLKSLPLYPEGRPCRRPTARRLLDLFAQIQRHTLHHRQEESRTAVTELSRVQRKLLRLLGLPAKSYTA